MKEIAYRLCHVRWRQELGSPSYLHAFGRKEAVFETLFCQECYKVSKIRKTQARQNDGYAWLVRAFLILMARGVAEVGGGDEVCGPHGPQSSGEGPHCIYDL